MNFLTGKKTYAVAAGAILSAVGGVLSGQVSWFEALLLVINGAGLASLRGGVTTEVKKAVK